MWEYAVHEVVRVVDGDTVYLTLKKITEIDVGFRIKRTVTDTTTQSFRLIGIDAPELRGRKAEPVKAQAAKARLEQLLSLGSVRAVTHKSDSFGRWLVDLYVTADDTELHVNHVLLDEGHAKLYVK